MSPLAEGLVRTGLKIIDTLILPRLVPTDKLAVLRHIQRVTGEQAAKIEAQLEHTKRLSRKP